MKKYVISYPNTGRFLKGVCSIGFVLTDDKAEAKKFDSLDAVTKFVKSYNNEYNDDEFDDAILRMASSYDIEQTTQSLLEDGMTSEEVYLSAIAGKLLQKYVNEEDNI